MPDMGNQMGDRLEHCEQLVQTISRREQLSSTATSLLAQSLALHGGTVVRWPASHAPVRVWLQAPPVLGDTLAVVRTNAARHGVLDWNGATAAVQLVLSGDSIRAQIVVVWASSIAPTTDNPAAKPAGRSGVVRNATTGEIEQAVVALAVRTSTGDLASPRDLHAMAIHEVGHALGLAHSPPAVGPRSSVMASSVATDDVTASDRVALRVWYEMPVGPACDPTGSKR